LGKFLPSSSHDSEDGDPTSIGAVDLPSTSPADHLRGVKVQDFRQNNEENKDADITPVGSSNNHNDEGR